MKLEKEGVVIDCVWLCINVGDIEAMKWHDNLLK